MIGLLIAIGAIYPLFRAFDKADSGGKSRGEKRGKKESIQLTQDYILTRRNVLRF